MIMELPVITEEAVLSEAVVSSASLMGLPNKVLASVLGVSLSTVGRLKRQEYLLSKTRKKWDLGILLVRVYLSLVAIFGSDSKEWLKTKNRAFAERRPMDVIQTVEGLLTVCDYLEAHRDR